MQLLRQALMAETFTGDTAMTTMTFNNAGTYFQNARAPRVTFAARLAALQARHEQNEHQAAMLGVVARGALALVPFITLAWMFVAV